MNLTNIDFYEIFLDEGDPFYSNIYRYEKDSFNNWMLENIKHYGEVHSYEELRVEKHELDNLVNEGYLHVGHQCHYSAKRLSQIDENYRYITGFVIRNEFPYPLITHSFNVNGERIFDFAKLDNEINLLND